MHLKIVTIVPAGEVVYQVFCTSVSLGADSIGEHFLLRIYFGSLIVAPVLKIAKDLSRNQEMLKEKLRICILCLLVKLA